MKNKIGDLRNHLFAQLERLSDDELSDEKLETEVFRAGAINKVADSIIKTAKVEIDFIKATGSTTGHSDFIEIGEGAAPKALGSKKDK